MNFVFFGTSEFAADILEGLINAGHKPVLVITQPDKPAGRGQKIKETPVKKRLKIYDLGFKNKVDIWQPEKLSEVQLPLEVELRKLLKYQNIFGILAAYGKMIPQKVLDIFEPFGIINIHPSLLPKYRGPSPIQSAIINGEAETGVTLIKLVKKMDAGPIIQQAAITISDDDTTGALEKKIAPIAVDLIKKILPDYLSGKIKARSQNHLIATYTKLIQKDDAKINWNETAELIKRKIRAYQPWPIAWTYYKNIRIQILKAAISNDKAQMINAGTFYMKNSRLCVKAADGILIIERLRPEGKKEMSSEEFLRGLMDETLQS